MPNYNLNLKRANAKSETPINLIIRYDNKKVLYSTMEKIHPQYFENDKSKKNYQRVKPSYVGYMELNAFLEQTIALARTTFRKFVNDHQRQPTPEELRIALNESVRGVAPEKKLNFFKFVELFISESEEKKLNTSTGKKISPGTIRIYKNTLRRLKEFNGFYPKRIEFETIDLEFYDHWIDFLSVKLNLSNNTVGRYTKTLKVFLNHATDQNFNSNLTFRNRRFKVLNEPAYSIYLNEDELDYLHQLDLSHHPKLQNVKSLFLFSCFTGLRYGDLISISPENFRGDKIEIKTKKTGQTITLPIHKVVTEIMAKYSHFPNSLPPAISNVKMNKYLKEVAAFVPSLQQSVLTNITRGGKVITEIKRKCDLVTVHTARRSFATILFKSGLSSLTIMKLTGHKSERVFLGYLKTTAEENAELLQDHWKHKDAEKQEKQEAEFIEKQG